METISSGDLTNDGAAAREENLLAKWSKGGRLDQSEFEEIRHRLPRGSVAMYDQRFASGSGFLDRSGRARYDRPLGEYEEIFGTKLRQLKQYILIGKEAADPLTGRPKTDLPPFDQPEKMAGWWARNMKHRAPARILALATARSAEEQAPGDPGLDVGDYEGQFADALKEARTLLAVATAQWKEASKSGVEARVEICQRRFLRALRAVKETEQAVREDQKASGDLIPKAEIFPEISELLQVLRHMRSTRRRRTLASINLDSLLSTDRETAANMIGDAVDAAHESEDKVLRRLSQFGSLEEVDQFQLDNGNEAE